MLIEAFRGVGNLVQGIVTWLPREAGGPVPKPLWVSKPLSTRAKSARPFEVWGGYGFV